MKTKTLALLIISIVVLTFGSCTKSMFCLDGNGDIVQEEREVGTFSGVITKGAFEIYYTQDTITELVIEAESNFLNYIQHRISGGNLIIKTQNDRCFNENFPIKVYVRSPDINRLELDGSGYIYSEHINTNELELGISGSGSVDVSCDVNYMNAWISGSGNMDLYGTANEAHITISGSGSARAYDFITKDCYGTISGSGSMYLNVIDYLEATISGSGSIFYKGDPDVSVNISGSGSVNKI